MRIISFIALLTAFACNTSDVAESPAPDEAAGESTETAETAEAEAPHGEEADHEAHAEAAEGATGEGPIAFGDPLTDRELVTLATIAGDPSSYAGQTVKTEGEIAAVCQRMGCWMEMRAEGVEPIRVPMAGHSFFLPKDVSGRHATIEGEVAVRELSEGEREHLESEGALATAQTLQISATGVVLN